MEDGKEHGQVKYL